MISSDQALAFALAAFVIIVIPGPSVVFVIGRALSYGRPVALASVAGNTLGLVTIVALVALGLGAVVQESILVFTVLKLAGAAYLVWLGVEAFRHRKDFLVPAGTDLGRAPMTVGRAIRQGYVVGASNPKGYIMLAAVLPQFVDRGEGQAPLQMLVLGLMATLIGLVSDSTWALVASQLRTWFNRSPRRGEAMGAVGGASMIGLGVAVAVVGDR
ncbi:LysE family translocator [Marmoricola sp. RAF53]|uniref:LysE family translocator n=1 Tax=Marmoricola sp. RAF53 TaxID=3233059 RepID=UPI003F971296